MSGENRLWQALEPFQRRAQPLHETVRQMRQAIVFGAGHSGGKVKRYLESAEVHVVSYCDNDPRKRGERIDGLVVLSPEELGKWDGVPVVIASDWGRDIAAQLQQSGRQPYHDLSFCVDLRYEQHFDPHIISSNRKAIEQAYDLLADRTSRETYLSILKYRLSKNPLDLVVSSHKQYWLPQVRPEKGDVIVDVGAWHGDTALDFATGLERACRIVSFEPARRNFEALQMALRKADLTERVTPVRAGLWCETTAGCLNTDVQELSSRYRISDKGQEPVELVALDDYLRKHRLRVDLIKVDAEGAELEILRGAATTIAAHKPKLQICVYHEADHLWKIPQMIAELNPEYAFYLAHHSQGILETVLYAS